MIGFWTALALAAPCDAPTRDKVVAASREAEQAFRDADPDAVVVAAARAREQAGCAGVRMLPEEVSALYRALALDAFIARDDTSVKLLLEAVRVAEPSYAIPLSLLPQEHPLRRSFDQATPSERAVESLRLRNGQRLWVDGREAEAVPVGRPVLVQLVDDEGVQTWLQPSGGVPPELVAPSRTSSARMPSIAVLGSVSALLPDQAQVYGGPAVRAHVPLFQALHTELQLSTTFTQGAASGGGRAAYLLPSGQLGLVARSRGPVAPWGGAGVLGQSSGEGFRMGGAGVVGVDVPVGPVRLTTELRGGWATDPVFGGGVGLAFGG